MNELDPRTISHWFPGFDSHEQYGLLIPDTDEARHANKFVLVNPAVAHTSPKMPKPRNLQYAPFNYAIRALTL